MNEFGRLRAGMAVQDITGRVIGTVERVLRDRFRVRLAASSVELRPDSLFHVSDDSATLVCAESNLAAYFADG